MDKNEEPNKPVLIILLATMVMAAMIAIGVDRQAAAISESEAQRNESTRRINRPEPLAFGPRWLNQHVIAVVMLGRHSLRLRPLDGSGGASCYTVEQPLHTVCKISPTVMRRSYPIGGITNLQPNAFFFELECFHQATTRPFQNRCTMNQPTETGCMAPSLFRSDGVITHLHMARLDNDCVLAVSEADLTEPSLSTDTYSAMVDGLLEPNRSTD